MLNRIIDESDIDSLELPVTQYEKKPRHYVDNKRFSKELSEWSRANKKAIAEGTEPPRLNNYIGLCIDLITKNYGKKPNFRNYSYLDEMIGDAVENVLRYIGNFDPDAPTRSGEPNAYGYVSLITHNAFTRRIEDEKREAYYKNKSFELQGGLDMFNGEDSADLRDAGISDVGAIQSDILAKVYEYEAKERERKIKQKEKIAAAKPVTEEVALKNASILEFLND